MSAIYKVEDKEKKFRKKINTINFQMTIFYFWSFN